MESDLVGNLKYTLVMINGDQLSNGVIFK